jgi:hypothetical protein
MYIYIYILFKQVLRAYSICIPAQFETYLCILSPHALVTYKKIHKYINRDMNTYFQAVFGL